MNNTLKALEEKRQELEQEIFDQWANTIIDKSYWSAGSEHYKIVPSSDQCAEIIVGSSIKTLTGNAATAHPNGRLAAPDVYDSINDHLIEVKSAETSTCISNMNTPLAKPITLVQDLMDGKIDWFKTSIALVFLEVLPNTHKIRVREVYVLPFWEVLGNHDDILELKQHKNSDNASFKLFSNPLGTPFEALVRIIASHPDFRAHGNLEWFREKLHFGIGLLNDAGLLESKHIDAFLKKNFTNAESIKIELKSAKYKIGLG